MSDSPGDFTLGGFDVKGLARMQTRFERATQALHDRLLGIIADEIQEIVDLARERAGELFKHAGRIQASIGGTVEDGGYFIFGVASARGLPFLRIQEFGGTVQTPDIYPSQAMALHFFTDRWTVFKPGGATAANEVFAKHTAAHPTTLPERSFMRYALAQRRASIYARFAQAPIDALRDGA